LYACTVPNPKTSEAYIPNPKTAAADISRRGG